MFLPLPVSWKVSRLDGRGRRFGTVENALCKRVADAVGIYIFDLLTDAVWAGVNRFAAKGVVMEREAIIGVLKPGIVGQNVPGHQPQVPIEAVEDVVALKLTFSTTS